MIEKYKLLQAISIGMFFGSILGRTNFGYWITTIAALGLLTGIIGFFVAKNKIREKRANTT